MANKLTPEGAAIWARKHLDDVPLIYSSTDAHTVSQAQAKYGKQQIANCIETFFATTAQLLRDAGYRRIISAGGETSGAVVAALKADALEIDPGVPAVKVVGTDLTLALKSGNFGRQVFFAHAAQALKAQ